MAARVAALLLVSALAWTASVRDAAACSCAPSTHRSATVLALAEPR